MREREREREREKGGWGNVQLICVASVCRSNADMKDTSLFGIPALPTRECLLNSRSLNGVGRSCGLLPFRAEGPLAAHPMLCLAIHYRPTDISFG
jgi:hypothetical protein